MKWISKCLLFFVIALLSLAGVAASDNVPNKVVIKPVKSPIYRKVGVLEVKHSKGIDHIAIDLWARVAKMLGYHYVFVPYKSVEAGYAALLDKKIALLVGPVKYEQQRRGVTYLNSYIDDSMIIAMPSTPMSLAEDYWPYMRVLFVYGVGTILLIIFVVGGLVWLLERKRNSADFPRSFRQGLGAGMWFALVTMTTNGYGREVPKTFWGRVVTGIYMISVLFFISSFMVYLTASLTSSKSHEVKLSSLGALSGKRIGYMATEAYGKRLAESLNGRAIELHSTSKAVGLLEHGGIDALLINSIRVRAYLRRYPEKAVYLTNFVFKDGSYAFAVRKGFAYAEDINEELYTVYETGYLQKIINRWLSSPPYLQTLHAHKFSMQS